MCSSVTPLKVPFRQSPPAFSFRLIRRVSVCCWVTQRVLFNNNKTHCDSAIWKIYGGIFLCNKDRKNTDSCRILLALCLQVVFFCFCYEFLAKMSVLFQSTKVCEQMKTCWVFGVTLMFFLVTRSLQSWKHLLCCFRKRKILKVVTHWVFK